MCHNAPLLCEFCQVLATAVYLLLTVKLGRRTLLLAGTTLMLLGTVCLGALIRTAFNYPLIAAGCHDSQASSNITTPVSHQNATTSR